MKDDIAIIIPAYNPTNILITLIKELKNAGFSKIIVVNDGSKSENIFKHIEKDVIILKHNLNLGKGMALKSGFKYCINNFNNIFGVITVDADGQHTIEDINNVYIKLLEKSNSLILGSRDFSIKNTPLKSFVGNKIISFIFARKMKKKIEDTQTGLRAIPYRYLEKLIKIEGERFEYEMNMLIYMVKQEIEIIEEKIVIIYNDRNKASNFKAIKDSCKIVKIFS